eukprot:4071215-Ditylum_brightwellii.AAC.1
MSTQQDSTCQLLHDMQTNFDTQLQGPHKKQQKQGYEEVAYAEVMENADALRHTIGALTTRGGGGGHP